MEVSLTDSSRITQTTSSGKSRRIIFSSMGSWARETMAAGDEKVGGTVKTKKRMKHNCTRRLL